MHSFEKDAISSSHLKPLVYKRYIDDIFGVWQHGKESLIQFFNHFNSRNKDIQFTMETDYTNGGWLHFLRFDLKPHNGNIDRKWYQKPSTRPVFLTADSHHTQETKHNVIINEFKSLDKICSNETYYLEASNKFKSILQENGYTIDILNTLEQKARSIYKYLDYNFKENKTVHTEETELNTFLKQRHITIQHVKGDGHCLLHSISAATGVHIDNIKTLVRCEFQKNKDIYITAIGSLKVAEEQMEKYLNNKTYNIDIVDIMPNIISSCFARTIYIFQSNNRNTTITCIPANNKEKPILLRRQNDHYDNMTSKIKWPNYNKRCFGDAVTLKIPYISEAHSKEIKHLINNSGLHIFPIFTPGIKLRNILTESALEVNKCKSKSCDQPKECKRKNIIYELECTICQEKYIGETQRELHTRLNEHNRHLHMGNTQFSAMAQHYQIKHTSIPEKPFKAKIIERCQDYADRKIREAIWIRRTQPKINRDSGWNTCAKEFRKYKM